MSMRGWFAVLSGLVVPWLPAVGQEFEMRLRERVEVRPGEFRPVVKGERWKPEETAVIVCDMWDLHHCKNAVERVGMMAPRMNEFLEAARNRGALIVHAPSSCMEFYRDHPARRRAQEAPAAADLPDGIDRWLNWIDEREERAGYPIDHSDGGEDDDPAEHAAWAKKLEAMGKDPRAPWSRQVEALEIDGERDAITDSGIENWNLLSARGVKNVILVGVHTNMCVLGRPFGLRQLARNGMNVVLMRDLTDTMYNPEMPPRVSHFRGTDLVIEHIEKYVCPTVTSDQVLGGAPFRFDTDPRPHLVFLIGEREYNTASTLPVFAEQHLADDFRCTFVFADQEDGNAFPGIGAVGDADVLFVSVRRRTPTPDDLALVRRHVAAGKPVVGIRTASHAFSLRGKPAPAGHESWDEWDAEVIGGNYTGHFGNELKGTARAVHPDGRAVEGSAWPMGGSLYKNTPLQPGARRTAEGAITIDGTEHVEPVAWFFKRKDGGETYYTSLGHEEDFASPPFLSYLVAGVRTVAGVADREGAPGEKNAAAP